MTTNMIQHYREGKPTSSWTVEKPDDGRTALEAAEDNDFVVAKEKAHEQAGARGHALIDVVTGEAMNRRGPVQLESESSSYEPKSVVVDGVEYWCVYDIDGEIEVWRTKPYLAPGTRSFWTDGRNNSGFVGYGHSYPNIAEAWEEANE